ncbi:hypothetical protein HCZ30_11285 [Marivivens donghaensis]|uniref:Alpha/beta hydrolase n=1 Tax=Marivivens donghaensis TaxID=1699413 RepID=A0ABX0VY36_9RHOB|nr:hypothetical protein [Marivivens donghaensis]NIY73013.1 hypothetical protein [Marivivens donghaensis]
MLIFEGDRFAVRKTQGSGNEENSGGPVVVTFPHAGGPTMGRGIAFGENFLRAKGIDAYHVLNAEVDWFQHPQFWDAIDAIRADIPEDREIVTYGSSMGGYGALLASGRLNAARVLSIVPQFSIDRKVVPWERRWKAHAERIGDFSYDVEAEIAENAQIYSLHDPRNTDEAQISLYRKRPNWHQFRLPYSGHTPLMLLLQAGALSRFVTSAIAGEIDTSEWNRTLLDARRNGRSYWRVIAMHAVRLRRTDFAFECIERFADMGASDVELETALASIQRAQESQALQAERMAAVEAQRAERQARLAEKLNNTSEGSPT